MDLKAAVGQQLMIGITGIGIDPETEKHLQEINPGFIILFARNISSAGQVRELVSRLKQMISPPPLIAIDQEGGRVIRFTKDITVFPGNMALGAAGSEDLAFQQGLATAAQLKAIGIDINLAPVVDVITSHYNPGVTIRSFGDNPEDVSKLALALTRGTELGGIAAVAKHFPGLGAAQIDPHLDLPTVTLSEEEFEHVHRFPFRQAMAAGISGIMTSHLHCPALDSLRKEPATFSPDIVAGYIRGACNYDGLVLSDDLEMGAIRRHYSVEDACMKAVEAGHDILLICSDGKSQKAGFNALLEAYTRSCLPQEALEHSLRRIASLRRFCSIPPSVSRDTQPPEAEDLASTIARQAVTVISPGRGAFPIDGDTAGGIHLLIPDLSALSVMEDGYAPSAEHILVRACRELAAGGCSFQFFPLNPDEQDIERIVLAAGRDTRCLAFIANALSNRGQQALIEQVRRCYDHPLFVLLDNPFDYTLLDPDDACVTAYGLRRTQLLALAEVIFGKAVAQGKLPFRIHDESGETRH